MRRVATFALVICLVVTVAHTAHGSPADLRIISYNVWGVPTIAPERPERIEEIGRRLAELEPDVVALQEVWRKDDADRLAAALIPAGLTEVHYYGTERVGGRGSGLWLASRHPVLEERFVQFDVGNKPYIHWHLDYLSRKGVALIDVETPKGVVSIANTHLQSTYSFGDYTFIQLAQVMTIAELTAKVELPLVLVGDLNAEPQSIVSRVLVSKIGLEPAADDFGIDIIMKRPSATTDLGVATFEELFTEPVDFGGLDVDADDFEPGSFDPSRAGGRRKRRTLSDHPCLMADLRLVPCDDCRRLSSWADDRKLYVQFLEDNVADTELFLTITRTMAIALVPGALVLARAGRRRRLRGVHLVLGASVVLLLVLMATWFAYVGWDYGPDKLRIIERLRRME